MKCIAVIPVKGREEILKITIPRLQKQVHKVIMAGHSESEYIKGTDFYLCKDDMRLGAKWQFCVDRAREYDPDSIVVSSSGGLFPDDYFIESDADILGSRGCYYYDLQPDKDRLLFWSGYHNVRNGEPIGLGRIIYRPFLEKCKWNLFATDMNRGMDHSTMRIIEQYEGRIELRDLPPMRMSSYKYVQLDPYDRMLKLRTSKEIEDKQPILKQYGL